jgi:hypothetical protein
MDGMPLGAVMKVIHHGEEHLVCLSSEEVALLVDLCHAAAISDHLAAGPGSRRRLRRFMGEVQSGLFETAQTVWRRHRKPGREGAERKAAEKEVADGLIEAD